MSWAFPPRFQRTTPPPQRATVFGGHFVNHRLLWDNRRFRRGIERIFFPIVPGFGRGCKRTWDLDRRFGLCYYYATRYIEKHNSNERGEDHGGAAAHDGGGVHDKDKLYNQLLLAAVSFIVMSVVLSFIGVFRIFG